jgi:hypothetical protein
VGPDPHGQTPYEQEPRSGSREFHPLATLFPLIEGAKFDALVADICENVQREPIWLHDGLILDGRNRFRACRLVGVEPRFELYQGEDPLGFVVSLNLRRRHLNESQHAMVAAKLANMERGNCFKSAN